MVHQSATFLSMVPRHPESSRRRNRGANARRVVAASPTRLTSVGYRIPMKRPSMSICTPLACPYFGRNWEYGKLEPMISSVSQSRIIS